MKRRLILLLLFILSLVAISFYGGLISYTLFYAVLFIPLISFAYLFYVHLHFTIYQDIKTRYIVAREPIPYSFILANEWNIVFTGIAVRLFADFSSVGDVPDNQEFILFPGDKISFDTTLTCKYRGEYEIGVSKLIITDFLGVFRLSYRMPSTIKAIVKPRIIRFDTLGDVPDLNVFIQSNFRQDINEPDLTVRDYIPGDPLKMIHWKSSARSGTLKVRNDVGTLRKKILLLTDSQRISQEKSIYLPLENKILEQTIALLYYFARQNIPADALFLKDQPESRSITGIHQFNQVYEELSSLNFHRENNFSALLHNSLNNGMLAQASVIFMVIQEINGELFAALSELSLTGKIIIVYVAGDADISDYIRQSGDRLKIIGIESN
jgi:uncharacterized protein (DUF58 family)